MLVSAGNVCHVPSLFRAHMEMQVMACKTSSHMHMHAHRLADICVEARTCGPEGGGAFVGLGAEVDPGPA